MSQLILHLLFVGQYDQNVCNSTKSNCTKCPLRLPSCIGQTDGTHAFPSRMWKADYITCYKNRTVNVTRCSTGYFHPDFNKCKLDVQKSINNSLNYLLFSFALYIITCKAKLGQRPDVDQNIFGKVTKYNNHDSKEASSFQAGDQKVIVQQT